MLKRSMAVFILGLACFLSCQNQNGNKPAEQKPPQKYPEHLISDVPTYIMGFSQCTFEDPWRINMNKEMESAARANRGVRLITSNGENRNAKQIADIENYLVMGVKVLIVSPREAAPLTPAVEKAYDTGIPVIVLDRKIDSQKYSVFIGASNLEIGREAGKYMVEKLGGKGNIVEIEGILGATPTQERSQGFHEVVDKQPGMKVIYKQPGDYKRSPARQVMENALSANDKIDAVYAHNDEMMIGAYLAAKAAGREKNLVFVGIDGQREAVDMIRQGVLSATFVYPNGAKEAIESALKILRGEKVEKQIMLPTTRVTKDEAKDYVGF
jgi:ribose transport system substrate-binding protein